MSDVNVAIDMRKLCLYLRTIINAERKDAVHARVAEFDIGYICTWVSKDFIHTAPKKIPSEGDRFYVGVMSITQEDGGKIQFATRCVNGKIELEEASPEGVFSGELSVLPTPQLVTTSGVPDFRQSPLSVADRPDILTDHLETKYESADYEHIPPTVISFVWQSR